MQNSHNENVKAELISGALLAGGKSQRMQKDKATLTLNGEQLYARGIRALLSVCNEVTIAGARDDLSSEQIPCHADLYPGSSLGGLHTAIYHAKCEWVCVLPCDMPFPSPRLLKTLLLHREGQDAVIPRTPQGIEPLIACYHKRVLSIIERQIKAEDFRLTSLLDRINVRYLNPSELPNGWRRSLQNLNRPEDMIRLNSRTPAITFIAHSGTGKTTLVEKLIAELTQRGWTIGALKHDAHRFDIDHSGKDSWRFTQAGAALTALSSSEKSAFIQQHDLPPTLEQILIPFQGQVDLILTEGFKQSALPKIEVYRQELNRPLLCRGEHHDPNLLAFAGNDSIAYDVPTFPLDEPNQLADFIEETFLK